MNLQNRLTICVIILLLNSFLAFSGGVVDYAWSTPREMKLKIINQTNKEIKIYLNKLHSPIIVNGNENYNSEILLMDFNNTYPFFIGIERKDNRIAYSAFKRPEERSVQEFLYYVIIDENVDSNNDGLYNINILNEKSYSDHFNQPTPRLGSLGGVSDGWRSFDTTRYDNPKNNLEILILNDTVNKIKNIVFKDHEKEMVFELDVGEARLIRIFNPIFLQGNEFENIEYKFYSIEIENMGYSSLNTVHKDVIRMEENMQILRPRNTTSGNITIWTW